MGPRLLIIIGISVLMVPAIFPGNTAMASQRLLQPAYPNHACVFFEGANASTVNKNHQSNGRENSSAAIVDTELPFSWTQVIVVRENSFNARIFGGYDPGLQTVLFDVLPGSPENINIASFDGQTGLMQVTVRPKTAGLTESLLFRVRARDITNDDLISINYDIRSAVSRIRSTPFLTSSPGDFIKPGQIVRFAWTQTGRGEKRPKCEAELSGRTGMAKGITSSTITEVLATKVQPFVLGHYLMTVTPRDVRGEPPRGSISNGKVFRCAFGSDNLPPVTDGMVSDDFMPALNQMISIKPVAVDPETGKDMFDNQLFDFGDGTVVSGITGAATHAYSTPGIYRVRCVVVDDQGLTATAEENIVVGSSAMSHPGFHFQKYIIPEEAGIGLLNQDSLALTVKGLGAAGGDRIVFMYNRNRFGRMSGSDDGDDTDIILKPGGSFAGSTRLGKNVSIQASGDNLTVTVNRAQFDRTGDPRFGRSDLKGIFTNQRIAVCIVPADASIPRVFLYDGNIQIKVTGGETNRLNFIPEESVKGTATVKAPDPKKQEVF